MFQLVEAFRIDCVQPLNACAKVSSAFVEKPTFEVKPIVLSTKMNVTELLLLLIRLQLALIE